MAYVYWLHLDSHTDIITDGYVGITTKTPSTRLVEHKSFSKNGTSVIHRAFRKYKDSIRQTVIVEGSLDYCLFIENKLRPSINIGWNMAIGGLAGTLHTEDTKKKMSEVQKLLWTEDRRKKFSETKKLVKISDKTRIGQKIKRQQTPSWEEVRANKEVWLIADKIYEYYVNNKSYGAKSYAKIFGYSYGSFRVILNKFKQDNWIPCEDPEWVLWYETNIKE